MTYPHKRLAAWERVLEESLASDQKHREWSFRCFERVDSTMNVARELLPELADQLPALVLARQQTEGRGRQGREWISPEGGFFGTFVFSSANQVSSLEGFSLVVGVVLAEILERFSCSVRLKWPNDILAPDGSKLGGVLIELVRENGMNYVLTGIGINLYQYPVALGRSISLFELTGRRYEPVEFGSMLCSGLEKGWNTFSSEGFSPFFENWMHRAYRLHEGLTLETGEETLSGTFVGIDERGQMLLKCGEETKQIVSAHIVEQGGKAFA